MFRWKSGALILLSLVCTAAAAAQSADSYWDSRFALSGVNAPATAMVFGPDGALYAAGDFTTADKEVVNHIARWDGARWTPLGDGFHGSVWDEINTLKFGPDGALYAGGRFKYAGGRRVNNIARWQGDAWYSLDEGLEDHQIDGVLDIVFDDDGILYAAGDFRKAGGVPAYHIARWDGEQWSTLGTGAGGTDEYVSALAFDSTGALLAGGNFGSAGGILGRSPYYEPIRTGGFGPYIARWTGESWTSVDAAPGNPVRHLANSRDSIYAVIDREVKRLDGSEWKPVGNLPDDVWGITELAPDRKGGLLLGSREKPGEPPSRDHVTLWNGREWKPIRFGSDSLFHIVTAVAVDSDGVVFASGIANNGVLGGSGVVWPEVVRYEGDMWKPLAAASGHGVGNSIDDLAASPDGLIYASGAFHTAGEKIIRHVAVWDGAEWWPLGDGIESNDIALAVDSSGILFAGGAFSAAGGTEVSNLAIWDGESWSAFPGTINGAVNVLEIGPRGELVAAGDFTLAGGKPANRIALWSNGSWKMLGAGSSARVRSMCFGPGGHLFAVGEFRDAAGESISPIGRWDGSEWHSLDPKMEGSVFALACDDAGGVYAAQAGAGTTTNLAYWNASDWSAFGGGVQGARVKSLMIDRNGHLYVGGSFNRVGNLDVRNVAKWNGVEWEQLGSGVDSQVSVIAEAADGSVYLGGLFGSAGGKPSNHIARWTLPVHDVAAENRSFDVSADIAIAAYPNPSSSTLTVELRVEAAGDVEVVLFDILGRRVRSLYSGFTPGLSHTRLHLNTANLSTGIYWIRASTGTAQTAQKIVLAR